MAAKAQAKSQFTAADDRTIEWYFAEEQVANYFRDEFANEGWTNIIVIYRPYLPRGN